MEGVGVICNWQTDINLKNNQLNVCTVLNLLQVKHFVTLVDLSMKFPVTMPHYRHVKFFNLLI